MEPNQAIPNKLGTPVNRRRIYRRAGLFNQDDIINDILKHLTTLNTGLLAILTAFSQQIQVFLKSYPSIGSYFIYSFYMSLLFCMIGFILSIVSLQRLSPRWRSGIKLTRDIIIIFASLGYIAALALLLTLHGSSLGLP